MIRMSEHPLQQGHTPTGHRSSVTAFVIFYHPDSYVYAMNLNGCYLGSHAIDVSSVTKEKMQEMFNRHKPKTFSEKQDLVSKDKHTSRHKSKKRLRVYCGGS